MSSSEEIVPVERHVGDMTRRTFVTGVVAAGALLPLEFAPASASAMSTGTSSHALSLATFKSVVGHAFTVRAGRTVLTMHLIEVVELTPASAGTTGAEQFSLRFLAPSSVPLPQGTFTFSNRHLTRFPLFVVPMGAAAGRRVYEAAFNRLVL